VRRFLLAATVLSFLSLSACYRGSRPPRIGTVAPDFTVQDTDQKLSLSQFRGQVVVLNFWATWCPPCVAEMPSLERLHRTLGPEGLVVLGVSEDEDEKAATDFVQRLGLTFPIPRDTGAHTAAAYRTTGYPESFVIDRDGTLLRTFVGPAEWDTPEALAYFRGLLPRRPAATERSTSPAR
jgi:cytochrome c biogenesis protein CcmG, thiol:disulfide interchange protein DsbE